MGGLFGGPPAPPPPAPPPPPPPAPEKEGPSAEETAAIDKARRARAAKPSGVNVLDDKAASKTLLGE